MATTNLGLTIKPRNSTIAFNSNQFFRVSEIVNSNFCCKTKPNLEKLLSSSSLGLNKVQLKWFAAKRRKLSVFCVADEAKTGLTYKDAGVDIDAGSELVRRIAKMVSGIGGFGGLFPYGGKATLLIDSKPSKGLRKFLKANCKGESLGVADSKLGNAIKEKLQIDCVHNSAVMELMRAVQSQLSELISGLGSEDLAPMCLGLSHSLSRYKLKFSPEKFLCILRMQVMEMGS